MQCPYCRSEKVKRSGVRMTRKGAVQKLACIGCGKYFTNDPSPNTHYPVKVILHALSLYNLGHPVPMIKKEMGRRYHITVPPSTIYTWTGRYSDQLRFLRLRNMYSLDPKELICSKDLVHQQVFPFRYHNLKMNISAKAFPGLKRYVNWVMSSLPDKMFMEGPRASTTKLEIVMTPTRVEDDVTPLCKLALERSSDPNSAHSSVEDFFLTNDDTTVCTELPVFLNLSELPGLGLRKPLTGHIDMVQVRRDGVWILDYKPNLNDPSRFSSQMYLYRKALHRRTSIPLSDIHVAAFNEHCMFEYIGPNEGSPNRVEANVEASITAPIGSMTGQIVE